MTYNVQVKNIIVGAAALYVSVKNSADDPTFIGNSGQTIVALPSAMTSNNPAGPSFDADTANWRGVGFTEGGVNVSYEPTFGEVPVDQLLDAAVLFKSALKVVVKTGLAEATLTNLIVAWGQKTSSLGVGGAPDAADSDELAIAGGALGDAPVERSVVFIGPAPKNTAGGKRERLYQLRRALNVTTTAFDLKKDAATSIPVELRVLQDPYYSGKEYGIIRDRDVTAV
jgi:hypothetical protein